MATQSSTGMSKDERFVILASSTGTVFEWYDFYLYATLAPFFAAFFFPPGNDTWALLGALGAYAAGFLVRPFGAQILSANGAARASLGQRPRNSAPPISRALKGRPNA